MTPEPETMDVPMFELPPAAPAWTTAIRPNGCGAHGVSGDWVDLGRVYRPVCNRTHGHDGPHMRLDARAEILAMWPVDA